MKSHRPRKSTDRSYQFVICLWIALRKTTRQIIDMLQDKFNIDMSFQNIDTNYRYAKRWQPIITYLRKRWLNNISRIPIANKAYRLRALQESLEEALTWHTKNINQWGTIQEKKIGNVAQIIKEARTEIEGEKPLVETHLHITTIKEVVENVAEHRKSRSMPVGVEGESAPIP